MTSVIRGKKKIKMVKWREKNKGLKPLHFHCSTSIKNEKSFWKRRKRKIDEHKKEKAARQKNRKTDKAARSKKSKEREQRKRKRRSKREKERNHLNINKDMRDRGHREVARRHSLSLPASSTILISIYEFGFFPTN